MNQVSRPIAELVRWAYTPHGTFGTMTVGSYSCYIVERPWAANKPRESCIPEGIYPLRMRESPVVQRTTQGRFRQGWEVCNVPNRTFIMLHPGNTMDDLQGCLAPGKDIGLVKGKWAVTSSQIAFAELMAELEKQNDWDLHIYQMRADYP